MTLLSWRNSGDRFSVHYSAYIHVLYTIITITIWGKCIICKHELKERHCRCSTKAVSEYISCMIETSDEERIRMLLRRFGEEPEQGDIYVRMFAFLFFNQLARLEYLLFFNQYHHFFTATTCLIHIRHPFDLFFKPRFLDFEADWLPHSDRHKCVTHIHKKKHTHARARTHTHTQMYFPTNLGNMLSWPLKNMFDCGVQDVA